MSAKTFWTKVSCPERLTNQLARPTMMLFRSRDTLVDRFPDRVLWGTDWPHPNMKSHMCDDGQLVDLIPKIATSKEKQQALLVDNPVRLYLGLDARKKGDDYGII